MSLRPGIWTQLINWNVHLLAGLHCTPWTFQSFSTFHFMSYIILWFFVCPRVFMNWNVHLLVEVVRIALYILFFSKHKDTILHAVGVSRNPKKYRNLCATTLCDLFVLSFSHTWHVLYILYNAHAVMWMRLNASCFCISIHLYFQQSICVFVLHAGSWVKTNVASAELGRPVAIHPL